MPNSCAIAFAVKTWSPVIITALIPAFLHTATACFTSGLGGSIIPIIPANVNSFSNVMQAIDAEVKRQTDLILDGRKSEIEQETRRFDEATKTTVRMRSKVDAIDYKYFIEPNIPKMRLDSNWIKEIQSSICELPMSRMKRYENMGLSLEDISVLTKERVFSDYFDECVENGCDPKTAANWITGSILSYLNKTEKKITDISLSPKDLHFLLSKIDDKTISGKQGKELLEMALQTGKKIEECLSTSDTQISDETFLEELVRKIVLENPSQVESYKNGRTNLFNFFVGAVMKETKGKANPVLTKEIITKYLS